jgi:4-amino-4-deoxy-L-arabinose transferase-like glycosyltransferase
VIRALVLSQPMQHDEAYTFIAFASRPFTAAISDYSLPNNHVFHTVLVYLAYHLLGNQPWIIRLPAFVAGVATIPLAYGAGSIYYSRKAGLLSAGLAAASPLLISYSANARGYTLICAFTLSAVILAVYIKDHPNSFTWALFVLACALGFYTIPIMLFPSEWWLPNDPLWWGWVISRQHNANHSGNTWSSLAAHAGLIALLYLPIFIIPGLRRWSTTATCARMIQLCC